VYNIDVKIKEKDEAIKAIELELKSHFYGINSYTEWMYDLRDKLILEKEDLNKLKERYKKLNLIKNKLDNEN